MTKSKCEKLLPFITEKILDNLIMLNSNLTIEKDGETIICHIDPRVKQKCMEKIYNSILTIIGINTEIHTEIMKDILE